MKAKNSQNKSRASGASLEALVFGEESELTSPPNKTGSYNDDADCLVKDTDSQIEAKETEDAQLPLFYISTEPNKSNEAQGKKDSTEVCDLSDQLDDSAWQDDDDTKSQPIDEKQKNRIRKLRLNDKEDEVSGSTLTKRLRVEFDKIIGQPSWAVLGTTQSKDHKEIVSEDALSTSRDARKEALNMRRLDDANSSTKSHRAGLRCLQFHPSASILMTAGLDKTMNLFKIEGEKSSKLQTIFLENFPVYSSNFILSGEEIILTSRRNFFHSYELVTGQINSIRLPGKLEKSLERLVVSPFGDKMAFLGDGGNIHVVSTKSKRSLFSLKLNGQVKCACFSPDGEALYSAGGDGDVYVWNLKTRRCMHKFKDEGCLEATALAMTSDYVACGSSSGVVNLYDSEHLNARNPKPLKSIMNLTTSVSGMQFNKHGDFLAMSSSSIRDSLKMFSLSAMSVSSSWPTRATPLGYVQSTAFSKDSGYFAIGNDKGRALLYRMGNYPLS